MNLHTDQNGRRLLNIHCTNEGNIELATEENAGICYKGKSQSFDIDHVVAFPPFDSLVTITTAQQPSKWLPQTHC